MRTTTPSRRRHAGAVIVAGVIVLSVLLLIAATVGGNTTDDGADNSDITTAEVTTQDTGPVNPWAAGDAAVAQYLSELGRECLTTGPDAPRPMAGTTGSGQSTTTCSRGG